MKNRYKKITLISLLLTLSLGMFLACSSAGNNKNGEIASTETKVIEEAKAEAANPKEDTAATDGATEKVKQNDQVPLTITLKNLKTLTAPVVVTFYRKNNKFLSLTDIYKTYTLKPDGNTFVAKIDDLTFGEYAIASFQDVNSDGVMDKNKIGIPKEPYAFSNNYKPKTRGPKFSECRFVYSKTENTISMTMIWK